MKVLYAFQGTGNGHAARARAVLPALAKHADVDVATSGNNSQLDIGEKFDFRFDGLTFRHNGKGGIARWQSFRTLGVRRALRDIKSLSLEPYDLVVNDFEPITAYAARRASIPCLSLSHQAAFLSPKTPRATPRSPLAEVTFKWFAPAESQIGFHFQRYDDFILPPILRDEIRSATPRNDGHITVYLPGYEDRGLLHLFGTLKGKKVHLFSKEARGEFTHGNVCVRPVCHQSFVESLISCDGFLAGAGFEGPAEALHLGKKLMVTPLGGQYEQRCNAEALRRIGVPVIRKIDDATMPILAEWAFKGEPIHLDFPDVLPEVVERVLSNGRR